LIKISYKFITSNCNRFEFKSALHKLCFLTSWESLNSKDPGKLIACEDQSSSLGKYWTKHCFQISLALCT
jgi:hypothetical protein